MSNLEAAPAELACHGGEPGTRAVEVLAARDVPLGGPRAMRVRRTLPQRRGHSSAPGALPTTTALTRQPGPGMDVAPHPHTGLQTVSWLFAGEIEHRDSLGAHALVRPGELNLMTSGHGICHSEVSTPATTVLHGVQLWVALPDADRDAPRDFDHFAPPAVGLGAATARVFLGTLAGQLAGPDVHPAGRRGGHARRRMPGSGCRSTGIRARRPGRRRACQHVRCPAAAG